MSQNEVVSCEAVLVLFCVVQSTGGGGGFVPLVDSASESNSIDFRIEQDS